MAGNGADNAGQNPPQGLQGLIACLTGAGYGRAEPAILQPAPLFLDLAGEDIRGRLYITSDSAGGEFCLRPEYTIPVCRDYLASPLAGEPASFSYLGRVFRFRPHGPGEFDQAGLESFGRTDREAADAEILTLALEAAEVGGSAPLHVRFGDAGLFTGLLAALDLPPVWLRRIRRAHSRGLSLADFLKASEAAATSDHSGVLAALEGVDRKGARALVEDLLSIAGISSVGGRSASEIAERFLEQSTLQAGAGFSPEKKELIENWLAVEGNPDDCARRLRALADSARLDMGAGLDAFDARLGFIAARGFDLSRLTFAASFGRNLDYYTGFVFEAHDPRRTDGRPVVGGGRYDGLMRTLGAGADIPAVGAAIWCERLVDPAAGAAE
ncbi:MAG: tRNA synthetase class [Hyphomicrobiales bacterium]|nr:tRNA synthetase class [Hyphomicrobiales bacterium]